MWRRKNKVIILAIIVLAIFFSNIITAQKVNIEYAYKHYTVQDGLVQMQVQALFQDSKGYLWCGTKTGVSRFDGRNFKNYTTLSIKQNGPVTFFDEDKNNNLLIFNRDNISQLKKDTVISIDYPDEYYTPEIPIKSRHKPCAMVLDKKNRKSFKGNVLHYENLDSLYIDEFTQKQNKIIYFNESKKNTIWTVKSGTISEFDLSKKETVRTYKSNGIDYLKRFENELYGFSLNLGIYKLIGNKFANILEYKFEGGQIKVIITPDKKSFIIKTLNKIYHYTGGELILIKDEMTRIRDIMFDNEGNLWVATEEGLYNFFHLNFVNYTFGMGNKDWVWSILEDDKKNMWFTSF